ncbi:unnamed protein product [Discosporangium mesarthrocarpum]
MPLRPLVASAWLTVILATCAHAYVGSGTMNACMREGTMVRRSTAVPYRRTPQHQTRWGCASCSLGEEGRWRYPDSSGRIASRREGLVRMGETADGGSADLAVVEGHALSTKTVEELWRKPRKHLISIGKGGVKPSHCRSLEELVGAHALVKVKVNMKDPDLVEVGRQLCTPVASPEKEGEGEGGKVPALAPRVAMVTFKTGQRIILFCDVGFLETLR